MRRLNLAAQLVVGATLVISRKAFSISTVRLLPLLPAVFLCALASPAQDLSKTVLPITQSKWVGLGVEAKFGTGFCLDPECRYIGTNYHVAMMVRPRKIKGQRIVQLYLATGPDDDGATINGLFSADPMKYNLSRDLAIYELRHPLPCYHGIPFSLHDLQLGQQADIYTFPKLSAIHARSLLRFHGSFKGETTGGLLVFEYTPLTSGKRIHAGASGGIVVDSTTGQVVGILSATANDGDALAMAVPIRSLADFVSKVQPWLVQSLFPSATKENISPNSADLHPKFVPRR